MLNRASRRWLPESPVIPRIVIMFVVVLAATVSSAAAQVASLCRLALEGRSDEARELDDTLQALNEMLFVESNPIPVKWKNLFGYH